MTWFKVDDGFYDHPKVDQLPNAAVGLWTKAGSWCSKHETDGLIPATRVKALKGTQSQIRALIEAGLWGETTTDLGAKAYSFRSWFDYQPSREERENEREVWRDKKRKSRLRKLEELRNRDNVPGGVTEMSTEETSGGVTEMSGTIPVPSRPDPTYKEKGEKESVTVPDGHRPPPPPIDSLDALANAHAQTLLCDRHQGMDPADVPPCRACEAKRKAAHAREKRAATQARHNRRALIEACPDCDDNGWILIDGVATRCTHHHERKTA